MAYYGTFPLNQAVNPVYSEGFVFLSQKTIVFQTFYSYKTVSPFGQILFI